MISFWRQKSNPPYDEGIVILLVNFGDIEVPYPCRTDDTSEEVLADLAALILRNPCSSCSLCSYLSGIPGAQIATLPAPSSPATIGSHALPALARVLLQCPAAAPEDGASPTTGELRDGASLFLRVWRTGEEDGPPAERATGIWIPRSATMAQLRELLAARAGASAGTDGVGGDGGDGGGGGGGVQLLTPCGYTPDGGARILSSVAPAPLAVRRTRTCSE
jgi:hypothetical protein